MGGKAANLGELVRARLPVPPGFVVTTDAYRAFVDTHGLADQIVSLVPPDVDADPAAYELAQQRIAELFADGTLGPGLTVAITTAYEQLGSPPVAVRSSATAEDLAEASFAGQQDSYLNISGAAELSRAVQACWASLWTARAMAYRARQGIEPADVSLAVIVQQLVDADAAGVMFTANPVSGRTTEVVISAAWGLGESVVSGSVDTDQIVVRKADRTVASRLTADKAVRTVRRGPDTQGQGTAEEPVPEALRTAPVIDDAAAAELVNLGLRIEEHIGVPQDIEWARAGGSMFILQSRPITALPPAVGASPTDWSVPDPTAMYVRASIVEQLPDPLSPLFADLIDGSVTRSLKALMAEFLERDDLVRDGDVGLPTLNGYAYYFYSRAGMVRIVLHSGKAFRVLGPDRRFSSRLRWRDRALPAYRVAVARWSSPEVGALHTAELLAGVVELLDAGTAYYTAVQSVIPTAVMSEVAFTRFYTRLVRRAGDPPAATFLLGFDSLPIDAEKSMWDLAAWIRSRPELADTWPRLSTEAVLERLSSDGAAAATEPDWVELASRMQAHLDRFGHTTYNLDFVNPVPADDPTPLIDTLRFYVTGSGADPYERQRRSTRARDDATAAMSARLGPVRAAVFRRLLNWAQDAAPIREDALGEIGMAWPQLRRMLAELGRRLVALGVVAAPEDVYWVHWDELRTSLSTTFEPPSLASAVEERRQVWRGQRRVTPPQLLPERGWVRVFARMLPATTAVQTGDVLIGIGASAGRVTAIARVLDGPADFAHLQPGEILVASITTPAWTSLFARASAIVTDVGGPLSHSSIVAREYGIPAVLGTAVGTKRIRDGQRITVDGDAGTVALTELPDSAPNS